LQQNQNIPDRTTLSIVELHRFAIVALDKSYRT